MAKSQGNHKDSAKPSPQVRFGPFVFDPATRQLLEGGRDVHLSPKSFDLLQLLIEHRPALVTKTELQDRVWPDVAVLEANVANAIAEIRRMLGDDPKSPKYVFTVSRRGYRFGADTDTLGPAATRVARATSRGWWLDWKDTTLPLVEGENVVGRHPGSDVWINATSVSREHARIVIGDGIATIEDCGSTNGTFVDGKKVSGRHSLVDGSSVTFGSEKTTFRLWSDGESAKTEPVRR
jgi:DNA-binding winged helix-turn-helix (wHTH) protein